MNQATIDFKKSWDAEAVAMIEALTTERDELRTKLEGGVRVYAFGIDNCIRATSKIDASNAVLIFDDGVEI